MKHDEVANGDSNVRGRDSESRGDDDRSGDVNGCGVLKIRSLSVELFVNFGSKPYFEGFPMITHAESSPSEEDSATGSDYEMQMCSLNPLAVEVFRYHSGGKEINFYITSHGMEFFSNVYCLAQTFFFGTHVFRAEN